MTPKIEMLSAKKLIGQKVIMSLSENKTGLLWKGFMPRRKEILNTVNTDLLCLQVYEPDFKFQEFNPTAEFEKWAAVEVTDFNNIPHDMEVFNLVKGLYAIFIHRGAAATGAKTFQYIFGTWLPNSDYVLDNRPHFEILGNKYINDDPNSEEEIWLPIKPKNL